MRYNGGSRWIALSDFPGRRCFAWSCSAEKNDIELDSDRHNVIYTHYIEFFVLRCALSCCIVLRRCLILQCHMYNCIHAAPWQTPPAQGDITQSKNELTRSHQCFSVFFRVLSDE